MSRIFPTLCSVIAFVAFARAANATDVRPTPLEANNYARLSTSAEITADFAWLAANFPQARVERLGTSVQRRPIEALVLSAAPQSDAAKRKRLTVEIIGSQHGMEGAGAESLLFIARELLAGRLKHVLYDVDVVLIANANPDGLEIAMRPNANGVNLNTDFVALTQPESQALIASLHRFRPEVVLDVHESAVLKKKSLALEGYMTDFTAQFEIANNPNIVPSLRTFAHDEVLTPWIAGVDAAGLNAHRYFGEIRSARQAVTNGGLSLQNFRNRAGIEGTLSFLMETRLDPKYARYATFQNIGERVARQRISIERFLDVLAERREQALAAVSRARKQATTTPLALDVRYFADPSDPPVAIDLRRIDNGKLERIEFADARTVAAGALVRMPAAYLVRGDHNELAELFDRQGIRYRKLRKPRTVRAVEFIAGPPASLASVPQNPLAGPTTIVRPNPLLDKVREQSIRVEAQPGDLWIDLDQPLGRLAALVLEPRSNSSLLRTPAFEPLVAPNQVLPIYRVAR